MINFVFHVEAHCQDRNKESLTWSCCGPVFLVLGVPLPPLACADAWEALWRCSCSGSWGLPWQKGQLCFVWLWSLCWLSIPLPQLWCSCKWVASTWATSAAIMPHVDTCRVVLGVQWARRKFPFCHLWEKEWVGIWNLVSISCVFSFCRRNLSWTRKLVVWSRVSETLSSRI